MEVRVGALDIPGHRDFATDLADLRSSLCAVDSDSRDVNRMAPAAVDCFDPPGLPHALKLFGRGSLDNCAKGQTRKDLYRCASRNKKRPWFRGEYQGRVFYSLRGRELLNKQAGDCLVPVAGTTRHL